MKPLPCPIGTVRDHAHEMLLDSQSCRSLMPGCFRFLCLLVEPIGRGPRGYYLTVFLGLLLLCCHIGVCPSEPLGCGAGFTAAYSSCRGSRASGCGGWVDLGARASKLHARHHSHRASCPSLRDLRCARGVYCESEARAARESRLTTTGRDFCFSWSWLLTKSAHSLEGSKSRYLYQCSLAPSCLRPSPGFRPDRNGHRQSSILVQRLLTGQDGILRSSILTGALTWSGFLARIVS